MRTAMLSLLLLTACDSSAPTDAPTDAGRDARADTGPPFVIASVEDLGALPHPSDTVAGRDGASSGVIDGEMLWTFGDTFLYETTPVDGSNVASATGAWTTPGAPLVLEQPVDENGIPAQLIPYTAEELAQNQTAPLDGWALWPGAVIDTGDDDLLVLFQRIKRTGGSGFDGVGLGTARIAPRETVARRDEGDLFSRPMGSTDGELLYGTGGVTVEGETAYFFACERVSLTVGCRLARVPRAQADQRDAFEFYDGSDWSRSITDAEVVVEGVGVAVSVHYNAHLGGYLMVTSPSFSNDVSLRVAEHIEGPWPRSGVIVPADEIAILSAGEGNNYLAQEHVALSSADGRQVVISYSRPLGSFRGEVRLSRITFE
jgi:hypothetical protein